MIAIRFTYTSERGVTSGTGVEIPDEKLRQATYPELFKLEMLRQVFQLLLGEIFSDEFEIRVAVERKEPNDKAPTP